MPLREPSFSIGIEEEYLLVDRQSRDLVSEPPPALIEAYEIQLSGHFSREFLRTQIEVGTSVCGSIAEARADLMHLRRTVAEIASEHGLAPIAASTHPFAQWRKQKPTDKLRYRILQEDMQVVAPPATHLRHARPCRHRRRQSTHRSLQPGPVFPAPSSRPEHVLSLLGRHRDRPPLVPAMRFR